MSMPLKWEFPGGKIDPGESPKECLQRELLEELGISVHISQRLPVSTHRYPALVVTLHPFICSVDSGNKIILHEHAAITWLSPEELHDLDWADADVPVLSSYLAWRKGRAYAS